MRGMKSACHQPGRRAADAGRTLLAAAVALTALLPLGCADWSYNQIALRQQLRDYERVFPEGQSRRTETTVCYCEQNVAGRTDAVVVLLTRDRQVCGKFQATHIERNYGLATEVSYVLRGEIDPELAHVSGSGPIDTLRVIADELTSLGGDKFARDAHAWVAAGIVRLLQRWPHPGDEGPAFPRLTDALEHVPGGGQARISVNEHGVYLVEYTHGVKR